MIAGVDGVSRGWVVVFCDDYLRDMRACFIKQLIELPHNLQVVAVDIPIGLPESGDREADRLARQTLGEPRRRSVFPCPVRSVLGARTWEEACTRNERADGRRLSKQTFGILRKIEEADKLVRSEPWARRIFHEVHPELSFAKWSGRPMVYRKKHQVGREERERLIAGVFGRSAFGTAREMVRGNHVAAHDLADAFAAVWSASRIIRNEAEQFPRECSIDPKGVPMRIWA